MLATVPSKWKEVVAYKLIRNYKLKGYLKGPKGHDYEDFQTTVYGASSGKRAESVFSEAAETTPTKSRIVVEIPAPIRRRDYSSQEQEAEPELEWENIEDSHRSDISVAILKDISNKAAKYTPPSSSEDAEDVQHMLDSQLMSDTTTFGLDTGNPSPIQHGSHTPSALFYNQLHESSLLTPPSPVPPANYISSSFEGIAAARSSDKVIVDLCDESDDESEEDFLRMLHAHDLTQQRQGRRRR